MEDKKTIDEMIEFVEDMLDIEDCDCDEEIQEIDHFTVKIIIDFDLDALLEQTKAKYPDNKKLSEIDTETAHGILAHIIATEANKVKMTYANKLKELSNTEYNDSYMLETMAAMLVNVEPEDSFLLNFNITVPKELYTSRVFSLQMAFTYEYYYPSNWAKSMEVESLAEELLTSDNPEKDLQEELKALTLTKMFNTKTIFIQELEKEFTDYCTKQVKENIIKILEGDI